MTLRFLQTVESAAPGFPFQPGQVIHLSRLTAEQRDWIARGWAELLKDTAEQAVLPKPDRAVQK